MCQRVVCGGLFASTAASLYFVPVLYFVLKKKAGEGGMGGKKKEL